jgi:hypothetical protein
MTETDVETGRPVRGVPKVQKPPIGPIFTRTLVLLATLLVCAFTACTIWASGISWLWDEKVGFVVLNCPSRFFEFQSYVPDGENCQLSLDPNHDLKDLIYNSWLFRRSDNFSCHPPTNTEDPIICNLDRKCETVCSLFPSGGLCLDKSTVGKNLASSAQPYCTVVLGLNQHGTPVTSTVRCSELLMGSYCDVKMKVTASNVLAIRGIFLGSLLIALIWFIAEWVLWRVDIQLRTERAVGLARMAVELPEKRGMIRSQLEQRWRQEARDSLLLHHSPSVVDFDSENSWSGATPPISRLSSRDPQRRFLATSWRRRIAQWKELRTAKVSTFQMKEIIRTILLNFFFLLLLIGTFIVIIWMSPQHISLSESWYQSLLGKMSIWRLNNWVDYLIFADIFFDTGLFLIATVAVKWPSAPVFSQHLQNQIQQVNSKFLDDTRAEDDSLPDEAPALADSGTETSSESLSFVLNQSMSADTCLMIACHLSTMTEERCETFSGTLRAALQVFPPSHIFVCDNGPTLHPQDETQWVTASVHPDINYVYIPEGNKTFAFYWVNKFWIPFLSRTGVLPNFTYAVIIDDDVPLPADLHIPHEHLKKDLTIKAVHFPITATTPDRNPPTLVQCQDIEYKLAAVHKLFQASLSRSLSCHGAIALWDRAAMAEVFHDHDTVFNGEDLYMGLCLLRKRDDSKIISCAQTVVPTYAPDNWPVLFRQRVKSWELTSHKKSFTYLIEVINPRSFFHVASLC